FSPDGKLLALGDGGDELRSTIDLGGPGIRLDESGCCYGDRPAPVWSTRGALLAAGAIPAIWDARGVPLYVLGGCPGVARVLAWSPDGTRIAAGFADGGSCVWSIPPG